MPETSSPTLDLPIRAPASPLIGEYAMTHSVIPGAHLPTPGKPPGWPLANTGQWKVDVPGSIESWRRDLKEWRHEHLIRIGYNDAEYRRPELLWSQRNYVHTQMMVEDRYFYDPVAGRYTIDKYLDDLQNRYGGIDSVLLWYVYPNIGIDDRNQTELARDLPGGLAGLKQAVADFHRRGVKVFLPTMPWDNGTRPEGRPDWEAVVHLAAAVGADGVNGDTYQGVPRVFRQASDAIGHPVVFQPEGSLLDDEGMMWNNQTWGKASTGVVPAVSRLKWLESRHLVNVENRWARDRTDDFQYIFFNGVGYVSWENVWGIWNQFTPRAGESLRRIAAIHRQFASLLVSPEWEPYATTLQQGVFATRFPSENATLWNIVNRNEHDLPGDQLIIPHSEGRRYFDVWHGTQIHPRLTNGQAIISLALEARGYGCVLLVEPGANIPGLDAFLACMKQLAKVPLQSLSNAWVALHQQLVPIAPTKPSSTAPAGMVTVPAGDFDFKVSGLEIEGFMWEGVDFQYPWENCAHRSHFAHLKMKAFHIDRFPVTNEEFKIFLDATDYNPVDHHNYLRDWRDGVPQAGWKKKPVTWVSIEDARAYAAWAGKRLPHEWEWQYAAQGADGRLFPWGNRWNPALVPAPNRGRELLPPDDVDAHPEGVSPFGVMDMVGNVWQWTDEYHDEHTRAAALRGGSSYQPQTSYWYFPQAYNLDQHGKYLLMAPCKDRSGMLGFRCVVDVD